MYNKKNRDLWRWFINMLCKLKYGCTAQTEIVGPKREMRSIWYDVPKDDVGPRHEMRSIWTDRLEEDVGPKREMKLIWADGLKEDVDPKPRMIIEWAYIIEKMWSK